MSWGVFDSGVGGLTVFRALKKISPEVPLVYLGDTARVPYGIRSAETVRLYAREAAQFFRGAEVEGLVVACNTASSLALDVFQEAFPGPVIGVVEPGVEEALLVTRNKRIGVIGTPATVRSDAYGRRLRQADSAAQVFAAACPLFVPLAEEGWTEGDVPVLAARRYLTPLIEAGIDTVVLGCTHYPLLAPVIQEVLGPAVRLVDSAEATARATARLQAALAGRPHRRGLDRFCVTDAGGSFADVAARCLGWDIPALETVHLAGTADVSARPAV